jgi:hypothetical protein
LTFQRAYPYNPGVRSVGARIALVSAGIVLVLAGLAPAVAALDARRAVEAFVARLSDATITDLTVRQTLTIYHRDGRHPQSSGEQRVMIKLPRRQRVEQVIDGRREVRLSIDDRTWVRGPDGRVVEAPAADRAGDRTYLFTPLRRSAADLLAEWKSFGVRDDVVSAARVRGRPVTVIGAGPNDRSSPAVWLDEQYGVVRIVTRERLPGGPALVDLSLSEHRPLLPSFYFPHRQELFADGKLLLLVVVRSVAVDTALPDSLFDPEALRRER